MSAHTPGPWKTKWNRSGWWEVGGPRPIVEVAPDGSMEGDFQVAEANAHLIAAAPEQLLEALLTARAHLRQLGDHGVDDVLDAAIAKAGGN